MNDQVKVGRPLDSNISAAQKNERRNFVFKPVSIQQRVPLFICILLTTIILAFTWFSYLGVRDAAMATGSERVATLADKLSVMFKGSIDQFTTATATIAKEPSVKEYLNSEKKETRLKALTVFKDFLKKDTTNKEVELLNDQMEVSFS